MKIIALFFIKVYIFLLIFINIKSKESGQENTSSNIAVIPFKTFYLPNKKITNSFSSKEYMDIIHSSLLYLEIEVGKNIQQTNLTKEEELKIINNKQFMSLFITLDDYNFYIDDNYFLDKEKKLICRYSSQLSTSSGKSKSERNISVTFSSLATILNICFQLSLSSKSPKLIINAVSNASKS